MILSKEGRELLQKATKDSVPEFSLEGQKLLAKVVGVYDADTCRVVFFLHDRPVRFSVRLTGIDTPEMRPSRNKPNRDLEKKLAVRARNRLIQLVTSVEINLDDNDKKVTFNEAVGDDKRLKEFNLTKGTAEFTEEVKAKTIKAAEGELDFSGNVTANAINIEGNTRFEALAAK